MSILGPFKVGYPVIFRSGGDTTRAAFGKHIQEIERIYGILNALDADKLSASDLDAKLGNFKPKMDFSDITGSLDMSRITGNLDFSRITGDVPAARVKGKLTNATIDAGNVDALKSYVEALIPETPENQGAGITSQSLGANGEAVFKSGLRIKWGQHDEGWGTVKSVLKTITFATGEFPTKCLIVLASYYSEGKEPTSGGVFIQGNTWTEGATVTVTGWDNDKFTARVHADELETGEQYKILYLAIGY